MRVKKLGGVVLVLMVLITGSSDAATTGLIDGAELNERGTILKVRNVSVTWDACGFRSGGAILCGAVAEVTSGSCPEEHGGGLVLWDYDVNRTYPGTESTGPLELKVPQPTEYSVWLYVLREEIYGSMTANSSNLLAQAFVPAPRGATEGEALSFTRRALIKKFKARFKRGTKKKLRCIEQKPGEFRCAVRWKFRKSRFAGSVRVKGPAVAPKIVVSVARR